MTDRPSSFGGKPMDLRIPSYLQMVLNRVMAEHLGQTVKDFTKVGINVQICRVLLSLYHHERLRAGTLSYLVGLEQTAVSHLLKSLTKRGLIVRERDKRDNRAIEVSLTAKGKRLAAYCHEAALKQERLLLACLSTKEIETLRKIVWKMDENIRGPQRKRVLKQSAGRSADLAAV
jgi:DNA-binding MarR family transcriptional regulator